MGVKGWKKNEDWKKNNFSCYKKKKKKSVFFFPEVVNLILRKSQNFAKNYFPHYKSFSSNRHTRERAIFFFFLGSRWHRDRFLIWFFPLIFFPNERLIFSFPYLCLGLSNRSFVLRFLQLQFDVSIIYNQLLAFGFKNKSRPMIFTVEDRFPQR